MDLVARTHQYIAAFSGRRIDDVAAMLTDDFVLEDPVVKRLEGKESSLKAIKDIFDNNPVLSFSAKNVFAVEGRTTTIIEFTLELGETRLEGVDIIDWRDGKLAELRAYLDIPK